MRLITVAHGTRNPVGNAVAAELTRRAGERLGGPAQVSYVELCAPLFAEVVAAEGADAVAVPLLLSTGHHVRVDLPAALASAAGSVALGRPLGPDPLLARAQAARLVEAGARPRQPVVLVAAGSCDPAATADLDRAAALLAQEWGGPVRVATLAGPGPRVGAVVRPGDAVSPYLLAAGHFADVAAREARAAGAGVVADVLGVQSLLVDLIAGRARDLAYAPVSMRAASVAPSS